MRVIELLPTRLVGVIADHGDFPVERIAVDHAGEGRCVGSVGHDEVLRLTDLREVLEDDGDEGDTKVDDDDGEGDASGDDGDGGAQPDLSLVKSGSGSGEEQESGDESDVAKARKRRRKDKGDLKGQRQKKGRNQVDVDPSFFSGL